ncbi:MAG: hypothetical protein EBT06_09580 [Gammaproteobacteria bacterium]|nr:hypothetical protein [Gammaproteobacteria bacterium]
MVPFNPSSSKGSVVTAQDPNHSGIAALKAAQLRLAHTLTELLGTQGISFEEQMVQAAARLPDDLSRNTLRLLRELETYEAAPEPLLLGDLLFDMGILHEKIRAQSQAQMEIESALINLDGVRTASLEIPESERISRFIALRDQLFRKVADVTLKVMLILLALLILGLLVGIV